MTRRMNGLLESDDNKCKLLENIKMFFNFYLKNISAIFLLKQISRERDYRTVNAADVRTTY